ncbi:hypothetical protein D3C86_1825570 [compost metagenome]
MILGSACLHPGPARAACTGTVPDRNRMRPYISCVAGGMESGYADSAHRYRGRRRLGRSSRRAEGGQHKTGDFRFLPPVSGR